MRGLFKNDALLRLHASLRKEACGRRKRSTPQASLLFSQGAACTGTCEPACTQTYTLHLTWQMLEIASQLPRAWCALSPACYFLYKGARGHGGIQTPIYPPSWIARVSGRLVVPSLRGDRRTEPLSARSPAQYEGIALASALRLHGLTGLRRRGWRDAVDICSARPWALCNGVSNVKSREVVLSSSG